MKKYCIIVFIIFPFLYLSNILWITKIMDLLPIYILEIYSFFFLFREDFHPKELYKRDRLWLWVFLGAVMYEIVKLFFI